jgi:predicted amidohydrolase
MSILDDNRELRLAVIQLEARTGELERNLRQAEDLVREAAREHDPDVILLPDACTGALMPGAATRRVAQRDSGPFYCLLRTLAREYGCWVGGGFLAVRGDATRCTYVLAEPTGATHLHDRDAIALWESAFAAAGRDDGFCSTPLGPIGLVAGLELAEPDTVLRLKGLVRMVVGGTCLASTPRPVAWLTDRLGVSEATAASLAPGMACSVGVPVAIAQQAGRAAARGPLIPGLGWSAALPGGSAIVDRDGTVLAAMAAADGRGYVASDVALAAPPPFEAAPDTSALARAPRPMRVLSALWGLGGRLAYRRAATEGAAGEEPLLPYNPPDRPRSERYECLPLIATGATNEPAPAPTPVGAATNGR